MPDLPLPKNEMFIIYYVVPIQGNPDVPYMGKEPFFGTEAQAKARAREIAMGNTKTTLFRLVEEPVQF